MFLKKTHVETSNKSSLTSKWIIINWSPFFGWKKTANFIRKFMLTGCRSIFFSFHASKQTSYLTIIWRKLKNFLSRCSKMLINIDVRNQALKLRLLTYDVHLVLDLDLWARKCSTVICTVITNTILVAQRRILGPCQISMKELFCENS